VAGGGQQIEKKSADGRVLLTRTEEHAVTLWDLTNGKPVRQVMVTGSATSPVAFAADGTVCAAASRDEGKVLVWDVATGEERHTIAGFGGRVSALAFTPDGKQLVTALDDTTALIWELPPGK
jgi:WD40 repeat protein